MIIASVSQSVSYFTVPPRAHPPPPSLRNSVRLRRSRSNTSSECYSCPPQLALSLEYCSHRRSAALPHNLYTIPITFCHTFPSRKPSKPKSHATGVYDACAARYPGRDEPARMRHCYTSFYSRPRFPQYPYSNILDYGLRGISHPQLYTVVYRARHICAWTIASDPNPCSPGRRHIQSYTPFGSHTLRSLYTVRGPLWAVVGRPPKVPTPLPFTSIHTRVDGSSPITHPHLSRVFSSAPY